MEEGFAGGFSVSQGDLVFRRGGLRFSQEERMIFVGGLALYLMEDRGCEGLKR